MGEARGFAGVSDSGQRTVGVQGVDQFSGSFDEVRASGQVFAQEMVAGQDPFSRDW